MKKLTIIPTAIIAASLMLSACTLTSAGVKPGDERNFSRSLNDVSAERVLEARLKRAEGFDLHRVDVEVAEGIVVLTGRVPTEKDREEAVRIAWSAPNVLDIGNEINVGEDGVGFIRGTKDSVLGSSIRTRLIADSSVKSRNINIETRKGIVYLLGVARTPEELERAAYIASTTKGVKEVVSYMTVHGKRAAAVVSPDRPNYQPADIGALPNAPRQAALPNGLSTTPQGPNISGPNLSGPSISGPSAPPIVSAPRARANNAPIDPLAPYYRDPLTGERIELDEATGTIPFKAAAENLNSGAAKITPLLKRPTEFPSDDALGRFRAGAAGETVSVIESAPYYIDPDTGKQIPVKFTR